MRVCIVNPPARTVQEPMYDTPIFVRPALACLGATLRAAGEQCTLIDAKFERLSLQQVVSRVVAADAQVLALTAFTNEIKPAAEVAKAVKALAPQVTTVIGGVHFSALPVHTLEEFPSFDVGAVGQGDSTIVELCAALAKGDCFDPIPGLVYRAADGSIHETAPRVEQPPLDELPMPAWDLLPKGSRYHLMTARGCPYACNFCQNPNGRYVRQRSVEQVVAEIEDILARFDPQDAINIWFDDEIFTVNMQRTFAICDALIAAGLHRRVRWFAQTHVNVVSKELFAHMKEAGCQRVGLGIESADQSVLQSMGKGSTVERARSACRWAHEVDLALETYFIIGHPNENPASARRTVDFAVEINPQIPIFGIMVPYPGTSVARLAAKGEAGYRLISTDWNDYNKQIGGALALEHLTRFQLEWLQTTGYLRVFLANRRYADVARFVWEYRAQALSVLGKWLRQGFRPEQQVEALTAPIAEARSIPKLRRAKAVDRSLPAA